MKKWLLVFFIMLGCVVLIKPGLVRAQDSMGMDNYNASMNGSNVENKPNSTAAAANAGISTLQLILDLTAGDGTPLPGGSTTVSLNKSMGNMIASIYRNPAASTDIYIADIFNSAGIATPAYAQGLGFASLTPILGAWKIFRNMSYIFFVIIMLALGFMIMLRQKIGGQAAVTAQQAIPRVVLALLAVTFSYAIAGLLIDFMYLLMFFMIGFFGVGDSLNFSIFSMGAKIISSGFDTALKGVSDFVSTNIPFTGGYTTLKDTASFLSGGAGLLAAVIVAVAIAINLFRLWFELLKTYVSILINIIAAPLLLMMEAIPGRKAFSSWIKSLIGNLMAFPVVLLIFIVYNVLTNQLNTGVPEVPEFAKDFYGNISQGGFVPPYVGGVSGSNAMTFLIGLGMILIMPDLVVQAKKAMGAKGTLFEQFGGAVADSLKRGVSGGQLIPGLGFTDTSKWAGGGISGRNAASKLGVGLAAGTGWLGGGGWGLVRQAVKGDRNRAQREAGLTRNEWARRVSDLFGDKQAFAKEREERKKGTKQYRSWDPVTKK